MKGGNHRIELLGNRAHRRWADGRPRIGSSASLTLRTESPRTKQARIMLVELLGTPRIGAHDRDRRKAAGARHRELDLAQLAQQIRRYEPLRRVGLIERRHPIQMLVDCVTHLAGENEGDRRAAKTTIALAPLQTLRLHCLHQLECLR